MKHAKGATPPIHPQHVDEMRTMRAACTATVIAASVLEASGAAAPIMPNILLPLTKRSSRDYMYRFEKMLCAADV